MNRRTKIITLLLCVMCIALGYTLCMAVNYETWDTPKAEWIPSPRELQEIVGVKPDGIIGRKTVEAWEIYYCEQIAAKVMCKACAELDNVK